MASATQGEARIVELEQELSAVKQSAQADKRAADARIKELEAKSQMLEAQIEKLAHSDAPLVPIKSLAGDPVNQHGLLVHPNDKVYAYHRAIGFARDPGYSADSLRGRAQEAAAYAFGAPMLGDPGALDNTSRFANLPPFSPESKLHVLVWVEYAPQRD